MRQFVICLLMLSMFGPTVTLAQTTFNKIYRTGSGNMGLSVALNNDGYMLCGDGYAPEVDNYHAIKIISTDSAGNESWRKIYGRIGYGYFAGLSGSFKSDGFGNYILGGFILDPTDPSTPIRKGLVMKLDNKGDTIWTRQFSPKSQTYIYNTLADENGYYFAIGLTKSSPTTSPSFYVVKMDTSGAVLWEKIVNSPGHQAGYSISQLPNTNLVISGYSSSPATSSIDGCVSILNDTGGIKNIYYYGTQNDDGAAYLTVLRDGNYLIWGWADTINVFDAASYLYKLDSSGNIIWSRWFPIPREIISSAKEDSYGNIVIVGEKLGPTDTFALRGWIAKLDPDGNTIWERLHKYEHYEPSFDWGGRFFDFTFTADGGYIITGGANIDKENDPFTNEEVLWLVKLDSLGCLSSTCGITDTNVCPKPPCDTTGVDNVIGIQAHIYPNPTSGYITIELPQVAGTHTFTLYNLLGAQVLQTVLIEPSTTLTISQPPAMYLYRITAPTGQSQTGKVLVE